MTAIEVDRWLHILRGQYCSFTEETNDLILRLFEITETIGECGEDHLTRFWITAPRGSFEEYCEMHDYEDCSEEELKEWFAQDYPEEIKWYDFGSKHFHDKSSDRLFYGVFLAGEYVLNINDTNAKGWPIDATEFVKWLIESAEKTVEKLKNGKYNQEVKNNLPVRNRYGTISRKDYWDIYPEIRNEFRNSFNEGVLDRFMQYAEDFTDSLTEYSPESYITRITARDYYEACAVGYRAAGYEGKESWKFEDSADEHEKYGGITPKEMYYSIADGRDDGMMNVPMDDAYAFTEWLEDKGPYYEFNGHHPWEVRPSGSTRYSIHLQPLSVKGSGPAKYFYCLSGDAWPTCIETIKFYVAMRDAGLPVYLSDGREIASRVAETDLIGILPENIPPYYARYGCSEFNYEVLDYINLPDDEKAEEIIARAEWKALREVRLKEEIFSRENS